jgi:hypothetical protein
MKAKTKVKRDGSEQIVLGKVILKEKPTRKRARRQDWKFSIETLRLREIEAVIRHRHGNGIPDPTGSDDVDTCLAYLRAVALTPGVQDVVSWCDVWAPWADPVTRQQIAALGVGRGRMLKADSVAKMLGVTFAERTELGLKTIGACDMSAEKRKRAAVEKKRERDRNRQETKRKADGRQDRTSYEAASLSRQKPWEQENMSRAKWYRLRREIGLSRIDINITSDTLVSSVDGQVSAPQKQVIQARAAGLDAGLGDHPPAGLQGAAPHGNGDDVEEAAA